MDFFRALLPLIYFFLVLGLFTEMFRNYFASEKKRIKLSLVRSGIIVLSAIFLLIFLVPQFIHPPKPDRCCTMTAPRLTALGYPLTSNSLISFLYFDGRIKFLISQSIFINRLNLYRGTTGASQCILLKCNRSYTFFGTTSFCPSINTL